MRPGPLIERISRLSACPSDWERRHLEGKALNWCTLGVEREIPGDLPSYEVQGPRDAVRRGHIVASPALAVDPPARDDSVERVAWTRDEVRSFLEAAAGDRLGAVWRLALATGLRRGELLGLQCSDFTEGAVTVARQVLVRPRSPRPVYVRETTKTRRPRRVRFDEATEAAL
jgi:integrase